jgi:putative ABC transport system permease protein
MDWPTTILGTLSLARRNVLRQGMRTAMTLAAIVFGVVGLVLSGGFVQDIFTQLAEALIHSQSGHLQIGKSGFFTLGSRKPDKYIIRNPEPIEETVAARIETLDVMGRLSFTGLLTNGRSDLAIVGEGVEPGREARLGSFLLLAAGRQLAGGDRYGMMIGNGVARSLELKPGDQASLVVSTADGAMNTLEFDVVGVFQTFSKDYDARAVRIPLAAAQELLDIPGANVLVVSLKRTKDTARVQRQLQMELAGEGLEIKRWDELNDFYAKTVELYDRQFGVLRLIILAMVLLSVTNTVNMTVFERTGEFGTMQALGNRRWQVFTLIVIENALLGIAGSLIGVLLGALLAWGISAIGIPMPPPPNSDVGYTAQIRVIPSLLLTAFGIGLVATVAASILPALRVARRNLVDALRENV